MRWAIRFLFLGLLLPAHGNIGDNLDQLRARYGSAMGQAAPYLFQHEGFSISVYFDGDHSAMEIFLRDNSLPDKKDFSGDDVTHLLKAEGDGQTWQQMATKNGHPLWLRDDHKIVATFNPDQKVLTVMVNSK